MSFDNFFYINDSTNEKDQSGSPEEENIEDLVRKEILRIFQEFDCDGDGFISPEELRQLLLHHGEEVTNADLMDMISEADNDGDGKVGFLDFIQYLTTLQSLFCEMDDKTRTVVKIKQTRVTSISSVSSSISDDCDLSKFNPLENIKTESLQILTADFSTPSRKKSSKKSVKTFRKWFKK